MAFIELTSKVTGKLVGIFHDGIVVMERDIQGFIGSDRGLALCKTSDQCNETNKRKPSKITYSADGDAERARSGLGPYAVTRSHVVARGQRGSILEGLSAT